MLPSAWGLRAFTPSRLRNGWNDQVELILDAVAALGSDSLRDSVATIEPGRLRVRK